MFIVVNPTFAKQIAEIENFKKPPVIKVGNLEAKRDWTDVRDVVKAYWLAITKGKYGEVYNICSGNAIRVADMLDILLNYSNKCITIEKDESRMRPSDVPLLFGDYSKFKNLTGWKP